jgi:hypothetical protein
MDLTYIASPSGPATSTYNTNIKSELSLHLSGPTALVAYCYTSSFLEAVRTEAGCPIRTHAEMPRRHHGGAGHPESVVTVVVVFQSAGSSRSQCTRSWSVASLGQPTTTAVVVTV